MRNVHIVSSTISPDSSTLDRIDEVWSDGSTSVRYQYVEPEQIDWNGKAFRHGSLAPLASVAFIVLLLVAIVSATL